MPLKIEDLLFLDFEASSLDPASWPVEIGMAWIENDTVQSWSSLIRPAPDWSMENWSTQSEAVHNITREALDAAPEARDVAREFIARAEGKALISDAPFWETKWALRLAATAIDHPGVDVSNYHTIAEDFFDDLALDCLYERLERLPVPHRAGIDAQRLAKGFLRGLEIQSPCPE